MNTADCYRMHEVPREYMQKWQDTIDVLAGIFQVPAGLIMRVLPDEIEVLVRSRTDDNPYHPGERANLNTGLYCETVMATRAPLHVPNALEDPDWDDNPDIELNMTSYIGMPLIWPDNSVFGTVCILDSKRLESGENYLQLVQQFKEMIELDFHMLGRNADLQEASRRLEEARNAADKANVAKSTFLANMSHELRTPMNAILGYSEMLKEDAEDRGRDDIIPDLEKIDQAGNHLLSLINDVLDLSKIESGKMETLAEQFDIAALIEQVVDTAQPLMTQHHNQLINECDTAIGKANQDVTKLRQSLLNLLSNAAKFTRDGRITIQVQRETGDADDWLTISVSDTGVGIPDDKLDRVFEEFSQAESTTTRDFGGTGLGLPISRHFCRMMGGDITVASQYGEGSTFSIRIPVDLKSSGS